MLEAGCMRRESTACLFALCAMPWVVVAPVTTRKKAPAQQVAHRGLRHGNLLRLNLGMGNGID